jgi:hypothetical protein
MTGTNSKLPALPALAIAAALALTALAACSTVDKVRGKDGASTEVEARNVTRDDPLARPIQVGWTSARASYCGFVFNPDQLRSDFLASEARAGATHAQMQKIERAYDYTRESVLTYIKNDPHYCNKERTTAIRRDLNRYLGGDFSPNARMAQ